MSKYQQEKDDMCVASAIMDQGQKMWGDWAKPGGPLMSVPYTPPYNGPTKEQFEEFLQLLRAAMKFDTATGQPDCEVESKKQLVRDVAQRLGVEIGAL